MKVLHLYAGNLFGGIETLLTTMARFRFLAPGMDPEFGLCYHGRLWDELVATGAPVHDLGVVRVSRPRTVAKARQRLKRVLAAVSPDVVATHDLWPHSVFAPAVRQSGVRFVNFIHGAVTGRHWVERWARRWPPDLVVANSRFTASTVKNVFPVTRTASWHLPVAPSVVDPRMRSKMRYELGTSPEAVVILQASRLEQWKGHTVLIKALEQLRDVPGWECWVAGGPQKAGESRYLTELTMAVARAGIGGRVRFLGQRKDISCLMKAADVLCQPNIAPEPFGVAFVEALYAGLPVVTSRVGGALEIVDGACGLLTVPGDPRSVATALASLIDDPVRRHALGEAGPRRAQALCDPPRQLKVAVSLLQAASGQSGDPEHLVEFPTPDPDQQMCHSPFRTKNR